MTLEHGLLDGQLRRTPCDVVAWPHWVPFRAGGNGRGFDSKRMSSKQPINKEVNREMLAKADEARRRTFLVVAVDFVRTDARVLGLATGVDSFLLIDLHVLMALKDEGFIVATALATVQLQHSGRPVATDFDSVPLAVVDGDGSQPQILLFRSEAVQIEAESKSSVLDLKKNGRGEKGQ